MGAVLKALTTDIVQFNMDMATLPRKIQIWASLFPLPQFIFGTICAFQHGPSSVGALFLWARIESFIVAAQIQKRRPFTKLMGPLMHIPFYFLVPYAVDWLYHTPKPINSQNRIQYSFVAYTSFITTISLLSDTRVLVKLMMGKDVGTYKHVDKKTE
mmetsp:Transcript_33204/g.72812  ORF Transcript_33204/g.72812 Transcript_33204/m.72812 type:complete len:157 (+) Transcript_33204:79-549(+)